MSPLLDVPIAFCSVLKGLVMSPGFLSFPVGETYQVVFEALTMVLNEEIRLINNNITSNPVMTFFIFKQPRKILLLVMYIKVQYKRIFKICYGFPRFLDIKNVSSFNNHLTLKY